MQATEKRTRERVAQQHCVRTFEESCFFGLQTFSLVRR